MLELGVGSFAGAAELGVGAVGFLEGLGLVLALVGRLDVRAGADVALVGQYQDPGGGQCADQAPDPGGLEVVDGAGQRPRHPQDGSVR